MDIYRVSGKASKASVRARGEARQWVLREIPGLFVGEYSVGIVGIKRIDDIPSFSSVEPSTMPVDPAKASEVYRTAPSLGDLTAGAEEV